jgi:hypothetical protein
VPLSGTVNDVLALVPLPAYVPSPTSYVPSPLVSNA